ncbi:hypothetical protein Hanom_Chr01g00067691 [Helianthus anomalus]
METSVNSERAERDHSVKVGNCQVTINGEGSVGADIETPLNYRDIFMGRNYEERERGPTVNNLRKASSKCGKGRVGRSQARMVSLDSRPKSRKRPRLDVDPKGLDPFGLDALLGINERQHTEPDVNSDCLKSKRNEIEESVFHQPIESENQFSEGGTLAGESVVEVQNLVSMENKEEVRATDVEVNKDFA